MKTVQSEKQRDALLAKGFEEVAKPKGKTKQTKDQATPPVNPPTDPGTSQAPPDAVGDDQ